MASAAAVPCDHVRDGLRLWLRSVRKDASVSAFLRESGNNAQKAEKLARLRSRRFMIFPKPVEKAGLVVEGSNGGAENGK